MSNKKLVIGITVVILALVGVFTLISMNRVTASEKTRPSEVVSPESGGNVNLDNVLSIQEQVTVLNQKAVALTSQPGWIFIRSTVLYDTDTKNNGVLPNGQEIPLSQTNEDWYHVNEEGLVFESVSTMYNSEGEIVQTGVFSDGFSWNSATEEKDPESPYFLGDLSGDLPSLIQEMIDRTGQLPGMDFIEIDGRNIYTFTVSFKPDEPITGSDFDQAVTEIITIIAMDNKTGLPVQRDQIMVLEDGTERAYYRISYDIQIGAMPSESIISIIEERE